MEKGPSLIWYFVWGYCALVSDILSIVGNFVDLTGIGLLVVTLVELVIQAGFVTTGYLASGKIRRTQKATLETEQQIARIEQRIQGYRQRYAQALRAGRKIKALRKPLGAFARLTRGQSKFTKINPLRRVLYASGAEIVPFLNLMPWQLYQVYHMYKINKASFQEAQHFKTQLAEWQTAETQELAQVQEMEQQEALQKAA